MHTRPAAGSGMENMLRGFGLGFWASFRLAPSHPPKTSGHLNPFLW